MSRQVDIKALVSHIVRGDGMDKCRICMGDTSEGQVHLTDTVMMDGDKAVTLSELLEVITGVEVVCEEALPSAMCLTCSGSAFEAAEFRTLVQRTKQRWTSMVRLFHHIPEHKYNNNSEKIVAVVVNDSISIVDKGKKPQPIKIKPINKKYGKTTDFQCPICDKKFQYALHLHKHLKESADLIRACHFCGAVMNRKKLVKHFKDVHKVSPYYCNKCPALFVNGKLYADHLVKAHAPGMRTCGDCSRSFKNKPAFHAHQSVHSRRSCPNCDKNFQNQMCYTHHVKNCCKLDPNRSLKLVTLQNKNNKLVKMGNRGSTNSKCICDYCNKTFSAKKYVAAHIEIVHTKATHRPCASCGKLFAAAHMSSHLKTHATSLNYKCEECGAVLKSKLGFKQHLRLHSGERPYRCEHCGETFLASSRRSEHIRNKHFKAQIVLRHVCTHCPARFRLPSKLRLHIRKVHKNAKGEEHECPECHEKFVCCRSLRHHAMKHMNR